MAPIRAALQSATGAAAVPAGAPATLASAAAVAPAAAWDGEPEAALAALGGAANVQALSAAASRLLVSVHDSGRIDPAKLKRAGMRAVATPAPGRVHLIVGPAAASAAAALRRLLGEGSAGL